MIGCSCLSNKICMNNLWCIMQSASCSGYSSSSCDNLVMHRTFAFHHVLCLNYKSCKCACTPSNEFINPLSGHGYGGMKILRIQPCCLLDTNIISVYLNDITFINCCHKDVKGCMWIWFSQQSLCSKVQVTTSFITWCIFWRCLPCACQQCILQVH